MKRDDDFTEYVCGRWTALVRAAILLGCKPHDAEDLVQNTLARCYVNWPKVGSAVNPDAYVHRILVNCLIDSRRRRWWGERPTPHVTDVADPSDPVADVDLKDAVGRALDGLTPDQRAVVVLRFHAQFSETETAHVLGIPLGTVKSRSSRALAQLATNRTLADIQEGLD